MNNIKYDLYTSDHFYNLIDYALIAGIFIITMVSLYMAPWSYLMGL